MNLNHAGPITMTWLFQAVDKRQRTKWTNDLWLVKDKPSPRWWFHRPPSLIRAGTPAGALHKHTLGCNIREARLTQYTQDLLPPDWCKKKLSYCFTNGGLPPAVHSQLLDMATEKNIARSESPCADFYGRLYPFRGLYSVHGAYDGCSIKKKTTHKLASSIGGCLGTLMQRLTKTHLPLHTLKREAHTGESVEWVWG